MTRHSLLMALMATTVAYAVAQTPTIQDCAGAIPVCQSFYAETVSASGSGAITNEINPSISCTSGELNSIWYTFTTAEDGSLGFLITPNNPNDDYDWALFNITNASCAQIATTPSLQVSCNASGGANCHGPTGANGGSAWSVQGAGCNAPVPNQNVGNNPFNALVPMQAGNTYVLMVSNWTGSTFGYTLDFSLSTGLGIFDEDAPTLAQVTAPQRCGDTSIALRFSELVRCNTVAGGMFQLEGPGGPYTLALLPPNCSQNSASRDFNFTISPPIASAGTFTLRVVGDGMDDLQDLCGNATLPTEWAFEVGTGPIAVTMGGDTALLCEGNTLVLTTDVANGLSYLWSDGSTGEFLPVTTGGVYGVTVTNVCGTGEASQEVVVLNEPPIVSLGGNRALCPGETVTLDVTNPFATYLWQDGNTQPVRTLAQGGDYTVAVTNVCGTVSDAITLTAIPPLDFDLGPDRLLCPGQTTLLNASSPSATYLWQDGASQATYTVDKPGVYTVRVATACESRTDTVEVAFVETNPAVLGPDTTICPGLPLVLNPGIPFAQYRWQDGSDLPTYTVTQSGHYQVSITTNCGNFFASQTVYVMDSMRLRLPLDTFVCTGQELVLDASPGTLAEYRWQDGSTNATLRTRQPGVYSVRIQNACEAIDAQVVVSDCETCPVFVPNVFSPNGDGLNDRFLPFPACELAAFSCRIFDRWGNEVFASTDPAIGWDGQIRGRPAPPGAYVWRMVYTVPQQGRLRRMEEIGDVVLVR